MSGSTLGARKAVNTIKAKYGDSFFREIGKKGGEVKTAKGFALMTPEQRSAYGVKGGSISKISRRTK